MVPTPTDPGAYGNALLDWYDAHARDLPWRSKPGVAADPYRVWLSEIMLQQTTVATVRPRFTEFVTRWPSVAALAAADDADLMAAWAGLGYYARARNLLSCARAIMTTHGGAFPADEAALRQLPGIGDYTAAAIAAIAFGKRAVVVDGNVERVVARLFALDTPLPAAKPLVRALTDRITPVARAGDFAQAMMDLGSSLCGPRATQCLLCPLRAMCSATAAGTPTAFPVKPPKSAKPQRYGTVFWLEQAGQVLLVRRPDKGLLGGMRALPTGPWTDVAPGLEGAPGAAIDWQIGPERAVHLFTHFSLELALAVGRVEGHSAPAGGEWWAIESLDSAGLPTVFAKVARLGH
ncbi:A/G-specific adenine glycosylase [Sphingomonas sp. 28-63-12]|uniref:A/G-specific adenine glycosylase n=1 Tax=Sphingomonas sp. 28-63-12 TaxID=1970434 RepID=UPI000BD5B672|nr:MAG: A/G-specific adenine glycosylase [Sphingomonas sp. 28-63-12]